eukprot:snap_masked-scaffold_27-processed-gene-2.47-mRNA-1 protein AED:1.00 eAED:1.00 QI:0/-1/0/0/-1/1/1/0/211
MDFWKAQVLCREFEIKLIEREREYVFRDEKGKEQSSELDCLREEKVKLVLKQLNEVTRKDDEIKSLKKKLNECETKLNVMEKNVNKTDDLLRIERETNNQLRLLRQESVEASTKTNRQQINSRDVNSSLIEVLIKKYKILEQEWRSKKDSVDQTLRTLKQEQGAKTNHYKDFQRLKRKTSSLSQSLTALIKLEKSSSSTKKLKKEPELEKV